MLGLLDDYRVLDTLGNSILDLKIHTRGKRVRNYGSACYAYSMKLGHHTLIVCTERGWTTRGGADGAWRALWTTPEGNRHRMSLETDTGRFHSFYPARSRPGGVRDQKSMT
ncbi:hypothetical protein EVAR_100218_1 [Eumeta japonica]|uniref:Uncharacterized protein n=1 Tax=Eumeta variegata TaxID=151549 RepID=A0A4C1ZL52_EUMVA|nr:hypothetical protein EVAR_100218_1 [Eumeta japonica]